jgi:small subunit ribosomal protein S6
MVSKKKLYECIFIVRQDVAAPDVHKLADRFAEMFAANDSSVLKKEYWGLRTLAYEVKKNNKGHYIMLGVNATSPAIDEFQRLCKINEDIIKCLPIAVHKIEDAPSAMMQAPHKATSGATSEDIV